MLTPERLKEIRSILERTLLPIHVFIAIEELLAELGRVRRLVGDAQENAALAIMANEQLRAKLHLAVDSTASLAVDLLRKQYEGFKGLVSYSIAADVLRVDLKEALAKIRG